MVKAQYAYGLNPFTQMPEWAGRRDRRGDMTRLILMADKGISRENDQDFLVTDDGFAFYYATPLIKWLYTYPTHNSAGSFRHSSKPIDALRFKLDPTVNATGANALLADGHVEKLSRHDFLLNSGRWFMGDVSELPQVEFPGPCCQ